MSDIKKAFAKSIYKLALPLARVLLRYGVSYKEFAEFTKAAFVEAASEHKLDKRKQSISRISVLTGLSRVEVTKVVNAPPVDEQEMLSNNRAARVINGWRTDKKIP
jgi:hypothetical protein